MMNTLLPFAVGAVGLVCTLVQAGPVQVTVLDQAGNAAADAVVFLESPAALAATKPMKQVEISQQNKAFVPAVSVVTTGTAVHFPNRDTVRHHVYSFSPVKVFEIKLYVGTPSSPVVFDKPGIAVLGCNIHDNMLAWTVVVQTPWFAKTGSNGVAQLQQVPPGAYRLRVWHPAFPVGASALDQALTVSDQGATQAKVLLPANVKM
jgi:plastocyanin